MNPVIISATVGVALALGYPPAGRVDTTAVPGPASGVVIVERAQEAAVTVGSTRLHLQAKATRSFLFVDAYSVGLYLPHPVVDEQAARSRDLTKALRVAVLYDGSMPGTVPSSWWTELVPALSPTQEKDLRAAFSKLSSGQDVWVTYVPGEGTRVRVDGDLIVHDKRHELFGAVMDLWLGPTPVSADVGKELRRQLGRR